MDKEVDIEEIKRTLKDADMYDSSLTNEELKSYYTVLKNSESTANEEEKTRKLNETIVAHSLSFLESTLGNNDPLHEQKSLAKEKEKYVPKSVSAFKNKISENKKIKHNDISGASEDQPKANDATNFIFGFNDMEPSEEQNSFNFIKDIKTNSKYIPIQRTEQFLQADIPTRAKMLYSYHSKMHALEHRLARMSLIPAPKPKAIINMNHFTISTEINDYSDTYISRSGRQTKRKIYCDENSLDDDFAAVSNKKTKNEPEWIHKAVVKKSEIKAKTQGKGANNNNNVPEVEKHVTGEYTNSDPEINIVNEEEKVEIVKQEVTSTETISKSTSKSNALKKLSNSEIMKRSKLFKDLPRKGPRCELLFDKLVEGSEKKEKEEKVMSNFEKTLEHIEVDDEVENVQNSTVGSENEDIIDLEDEEPKRIRVIPPLPGRRPINRRQNNSVVTPLSVVIETLSTKAKEKSNTRKDNEEPTNSSPTKKRNTPKRKIARPVVTKKNSASTSQDNLQQCPICDVSFSKDKIQEHAATCGDEGEVVTTRSTTKLSRMTCEICDAVIPLATEYHAHVNECIKANQLGERN